MHGSWGEQEFDHWLERKLSVELAVVVSKMQEKVEQRLTHHHKDLTDAVLIHIESALDAGRSKMTQHVGEKVPDPGARISHASSRHHPPGFAEGTGPGSCVSWGGTDAHSEPPDPTDATEGHLPRMTNQLSMPEKVAQIVQSSLKSPAPRATSRATSNTEDSSKPGKGAGRGLKGTLRSTKMTLMAPTSNNGATGVSRMVQSHIFEMACCLVIIFNAVVTAVEVQYSGYQLAWEINHEDSRLLASDAEWPGADIAFLVAAVACFIFFSVEFVVRVVDMKFLTFRDKWMWTDLILLALSCFDLTSRLGMTSGLGAKATVMRTARIIRALRMVRVLKYQESFSSFFLLIKSIQASKQALVWSVLLLFFMMSCVGMLMNQLILDSLAHSNASMADRRAVFDYFGTYTRVLVTMLELTVGNWAPASRLLMTKVGESWGLFILAYRFLCCFALVNVTAAVFITETHRVASNDDEVIMMRKERANRTTTAKMRDIFVELDTSGDGSVTFEEFQHLMEDRFMMEFMATIGIEIDDLQEIFRLMDDGDGQVHFDEFIKGIRSLRGEARNMDVQTLLNLTREMDRKISAVCQAQGVEAPSRVTFRPGALSMGSAVH